ncbi:Luciferin 4-monooxygenase [Papilio machaon]|uniref:Luciferin 4-monooxygenase n=1 Tax=Papilio machaon TaxID=76193 RepID=A0A194R547_PAPMA|nr:Luciferin 4-monooxygenase [Papilio machaon]
MLKNPKYVYGEEDLYLPAHLNFGSFMLKNLWMNKDKVTLTNGSTHETLTCGEIAQEAMNLAVSLRNIGLKRGEVVAICSENRKEFWGTVIGIICAGGVVTTLNPGYSKDELKHVMNISKPKYVFCSPNTYSVCGKTLKSVSSVSKIILYGDVYNKENNTLSYNNLAKTNGKGEVENYIDYEEFEVVEVNGQIDTLFILYSSGTTGLPKGVMLTHLNVLVSCSLEPTMQADAVNLIITPWYHTMGLIGTLRGLSTAINVVYLPKFEIESYLNTIQQYKVNLLIVVPPVLVALCKYQSKHDVSSVNVIYSGAAPLHGDTIKDVNLLIVVPPVLVALCKYQSKHDVSSVNVIYSGAAPLHGDTIKDVHKRFPKLQSVLQGYGMTEVTLAVARDVQSKAHLAKPGGVGFIVKNTVIKVVDIHTREPLGPNQPGEICAKGVIVMKGYVGKSKEDDFDDEGFFKTGDIGYYDENKYFFIVDRLKELIKYKAYQVPPMELEAVLLQHPAVRDAGVVGLPHASAGEVPLAFVVLQPNANATEKELQQFVADRLSNPKHLRGGVRFVEEIPKNPSGKILRKRLREMIKNRKSKL